MAEGEIHPTLIAASQNTHNNMSTKIPELVYQWLKYIQFVALPPTCILCKESVLQTRDLCTSCEALLLTIDRPCWTCGSLLPPGSFDSIYCGSCLTSPPHYSRLLAPFRYSPPVSTLLAAYKYNARLVNGKVLSQLLGNYLISHYRTENLPEMLIPVPLHRSRLRKRGFNQAHEIAKVVSHELKIPINRKLVRRTKNTAQQTGLDARKRARNVQGAFTINGEYCFQPESTVAIIDDVVTTGSTVSELAKLLRRTGAKEVHIWALARTVY